MVDKKGSSLDIFDSLSKKKESGMPSDSGVVPKTGGTSKAPPPPPSLSRPKSTIPGGVAPPGPPSLAALAAPVARASAPPPPSSLRPQTAPPPPSSLRPQTAPPPPPSSLRPQTAPPPPSLRPSAPTPAPPAFAPRPSTPPPPPRSLPTPSLPRPPAVPSALNAYSGDAEDDAPTRLYSGGGSQPPPPMKTIPRNERPVSAPHAAPAAPNPFKNQRPFAAPANHTKAYAIGALVIAIAAAMAVYFLGGRKGTLTVTVSGPGGRPLDGVAIFVDGVQRCSESPCTIQDLASGAHLVRAGAKGYQETAEQAVSVDSGQQGTHNITLAAAGVGTGVRVSALGSGLRLYVDGQEIGELPQTAKNLTPGEHTLRVAGSDRYEPYEERVILEDGELKSIGPLKLRVKKGLATFKAGPGADGARVLLDGRLVPELPATIEVPAGKQLSLVATKTGYSTYRRSINFDDGIAEKSFEITMAEGSEDAPPPASETDTPAPAPRSKTPPVTAKHSTPAPPSRTPATGKAVLNMNSIPVSTVILNGKPLGPTPKVGIQVTPGPQTVVFMHPTLGRKVMSANVGAGETKTFMAKLQ